MLAEKFTQNKAEIFAILIGAACNMYDTSARLAHESRFDDADNVAAKAKRIINRALVEADFELD